MTVLFACWKAEWLGGGPDDRYDMNGE